MLNGFLLQGPTGYRSPIAAEFGRFVAVLLAIAAASLAGCAAPAAGPAMVPERSVNFQCVSADVLNDEVSLGSVGGGSETRGWDRSLVSSESLAEALRTTLTHHGFLNKSNGAARFRLDAFLVELNQPAAGYTTEVVSFIRYKLTGSGGGQLVYDDVMTAAYTLDVNDVFYGVKRVKLASEGSVRTNIGMFIEDLCSAKSADALARS